MKGRFVVLGVLISTLGGSLGFAIDKVTFKCEDKSSSAVNKWGGARGKCIVKCKQSQIKGGGCDPSNPTADSKTMECISKADAKYTGTVSKACGATMPDCGPYVDDMTSMPFASMTYADNQIAAQGALINLQGPFLLCDSDPNNVGAEFKCESKVISNLAKLSQGIGKCLGKCNSALLVKGDNSRDCDPNSALDASSLDATTGTCVGAATSKAKAAIDKACPTLPTCGLYAADNTSDLLLTLVTGTIGNNYSDPNSAPYCDPNSP